MAGSGRRRSEVRGLAARRAARLRGRRDQDVVGRDDRAGHVAAAGVLEGLRLVVVRRRGDLRATPGARARKKGKVNSCTLTLYRPSSAVGHVLRRRVVPRRARRPGPVVLVGDPLQHALMRENPVDGDRLADLLGIDVVDGRCRRRHEQTQGHRNGGSSNRGFSQNTLQAIEITGEGPCRTLTQVPGAVESQTPGQISVRRSARRSGKLTQLNTRQPPAVGRRDIDVGAAEGSASI